MSELTSTNTNQTRNEPTPTPGVLEPRVGLGERGPFRWKFLSTVAMCRANRVLDRIPISRWIHRRILSRLAFTEFDVELQGLPPELDGFTVAFASDLHVGSYLHEAELTTIFKLINSVQPDLVCLGGDLINSRLTELAPFERALEEIDPPHGVFAVEGNHDIFFVDEREAWTDEIERLGIRYLTNRGVRIGESNDSFWLAGVDDLEEGRPDIAAALAGRRADEPVVLLSHHPDFFPFAAEVGVDLQLSGHTHGGQICLFGRAVVTHSSEGFTAGWFQRDASRLYVSRGVGSTLLPLRLNCDPEINLVRLRTSPRDCSSP